MSMVATKRATITKVGRTWTRIDGDQHTMTDIEGWAFDGIESPKQTVHYVTRNGPGGWEVCELDVMADMVNVFGEEATLAFARSVQDGEWRDGIAARGRA